MDVNEAQAGADGVNSGHKGDVTDDASGLDSTAGQGGAPYPQEETKDPSQSSRDDEERYPEPLLDYHREMIAVFLPFDNRIREKIEERNMGMIQTTNTTESDRLDQSNNTNNSAEGQDPTASHSDQAAQSAMGSGAGTSNAASIPERDDGVIRIDDEDVDGKPQAQRIHVSVDRDNDDLANENSDEKEYLSVNTLSKLSKLEFEDKFGRMPKSDNGTASVGTEAGSQQSKRTDNHSKRGNKDGPSAELLYVEKIVKRGGPSHVLNSNGDGLCIASQGLGLGNVLTFFLQLYAHDKNLVLLLNTTPSEVEFYKESMMRIRAMRGNRDPLNVNPNMVKTIDVGTLANERRKIYLGGGVICASSRVLIVDLLNDVFPTELLTGVLINHAHQISDSSQEAFILTLIREKNKPAFFKAFSDRPERFVQGGLWKLEEIMRVLYMRHVFLWPRFHVSVTHSLSKNGSVVVTDVSVPLTRLMKDIQEGLLECMKECLSELKRSNPMLDPDDLTVENALFRNFTTLINIQLEPISHRISSKTKTLVKDLTTLRSTLFYLLTYDSVAFNEHLDNIRMMGMESLSSSSSANQWLLLDASHTVFGSAKRRVFYKDPDFPGIPLLNIPPSIVPVLEEQPKWKALKQVLEQIDEERSKLPPDETGPILIMVDGDRACTQVRDYLDGFKSWASNDKSGVYDRYFPKDEYMSTTNSPIDSESKRPLKKKKQPKFSTSGSMQMMYTRLSRYFKWKSNIPTVATNLSTKDENNNNNDKNQNGKEDAMYSKVQQKTNQTNNKRRRVRGSALGNDESGRTSSRPVVPGSATAAGEEFLEESAQIKRLIGAHPEGDEDGDNEDNDKDVSNLINIDIDMGALPSTERLEVDEDEDDDNDIEGNNKSTKIIEIPEDGQQNEPNIEMDDDGSGMISIRLANRPTDVNGVTIDSILGDGEAVEADFLDNFGVINPGQMIIVRPFAETSASIRSDSQVGGDIDARELEDLRPRWVIMMDANIGFVRRLEVYKATNPWQTLNVYFMTYVDSVEEQLYLSALRRENFAFQKLIYQKGNMAVPIDQDGRSTHTDDSDVWRNLDRRIAAQKSGFSGDHAHDLIVDIREFRSKFPYKCHKEKMKVLPCMLEVGDYVLSPMICVERKSIPDLIQSFKSGRLYSQCESMTLHYKIPILLIEFDKSKGFVLLGDHDLSPEIRANDLTSRLSLLLLHFPKVRIIWAMSCAAGAEIFTDLKKNQDPPSIEEAQSIGVESTDLIDSSHAITPTDILRSLPGITDRNYKYVMTKIKNLKQLAEMDIDAISKLIGTENGKKLHGFIHKDSRVPDN